MSKILYKGDFVKTNALSRKFPIGELRCYVCGRSSCAPVWAQMAKSNGGRLKMSRRIVCKPCMGDVFDNGESVAAFLDEHPPWWENRPFG